MDLGVVPHSVGGPAADGRSVGWGAIVTRGTRILLASLLLVAVGAADTDHPREIADQIVGLAERPDVLGLTERFHYPPTYTQAERQADSSDLADSLRFLFERLGKPQSPRLRRVPASVYEIGLSGGTVPYWESLSPFKTHTFLYSVQFSKAGPGFLKVDVFRNPAQGRLELQGLSFCLPAAPATKTEVVEIMVELSAKIELPTPPNFKKLLQEQLQPSDIKTGSDQ
jgi:hypothetical protein